MDQEVGEGEQHQEDKALYPRRLGPAFREEGFEHQREDYAAYRAACVGYACGVAAVKPEEMPDGCSGRSHDQGCTDAAEKAEDDEEVPVL